MLIRQRVEYRWIDFEILASKSNGIFTSEKAFT